MMNAIFSTLTRPTFPGNRIYAIDCAKIAKHTRAAVDTAKEAAEAAKAEAAKVTTPAEGVIVYWTVSAEKAKEAAARAIRAARHAEAIAAEAIAAEVPARGIYTPRRAYDYMNKVTAAAEAAKEAAAEAAKEAAEAIRKPTAAEKKEAAEARIYRAIEGGKGTPAEVWRAIAAEGYTVINRNIFTAAIGAEAGKAYYNSIINLCGKVTAALLWYHTTKTKEAADASFDSLRILLNRIGIKYAFTAATIDVLAARAYTYKRTYGEGYSAKAIGAAGMLKELLAHVTAADTVKEAAEAKAAKEAAKEARRLENKAKKAAKAAKRAAKEAAKNKKTA